MAKSTDELPAMVGHSSKKQGLQGLGRLSHWFLISGVVCVIFLFSNIVMLGNIKLNMYVVTGNQKLQDHIERSLSIDLGNGECEWTPPRDAPQDQVLFATLFVAFPGSGQRSAFMHLEGLTELRASDDQRINPGSMGKKFAFMKTNYPLHDGTWWFDAAFDDGLNQAILLVRNPRWSLPSYQHLLYEIEYSTSWYRSYQLQYQTYTKRPPLEDWLLWRDLRFDIEIKKWGWFMDFWMEGGLLRDIFTNELTTPEHFGHLIDSVMYGQAELLAEQQFLGDVSAYIDGKCGKNITTCQPAAIASYERIVDPATGPSEVARFVSVIEGKPGINMISEEARACVWEELVINEKGNANTLPDRDQEGPPEEAFGFTLEQMYQIQNEILRLRDKYSSPPWSNQTIPQAFVGYLDSYLEENDIEIAAMS